MKKHLLAQRRSILLLMTLSFCSLLVQANELQIIGYVEAIRLMPQGFQLNAKIDTGADNSSIDAQNIEYYEKQGDTWVRFNVRNNNDESTSFDLPVLHFTEVKRKQGGSIERPVVAMMLCLGNRQYRAEVNLSKRSHFSYRMLIGRSFLSGRYLVDASREHTQATHCTAT